MHVFGNAGWWEGCGKPAPYGRSFPQPPEQGIVGVNALQRFHPRWQVPQTAVTGGQPGYSRLPAGSSSYWLSALRMSRVFKADHMLLGVLHIAAVRGDATGCLSCLWRNPWPDARSTTL
jgi:hypothetical protein